VESADHIPLRDLMDNMLLFVENGSGITLRNYQRAVAQAISDSIRQHNGWSFVVMFPRQSGKNELQAQLETYLLCLYMDQDLEIVKVSPTWKPQSLNAMRRLQRILERNSITQPLWAREQGYIYRVGHARIFFLSGGLQANIVGATASLLLEVDEAQDVSPAKFDKDIAPMAASTNATRVFWGTAWTSDTLLARELRAARAAQESDGCQRVFVCTADDVSAEVPAYAGFVREQVAKFGRFHPMIKSQFYSEEIDAETGLFPPARRALMRGSHLRQQQPGGGRLCAFLIDVAGEDEAAREGTGKMKGEAFKNPGRDSTALTIVGVDLTTAADPLVKAPTYRVLDRRLWTGIKHTALYQQLLALTQNWRPVYLVIDATGVGAGLASFLSKALPGRVLPYEFNARTKSDLGWKFVTICETGRFKDYQIQPGGDETELFWRQVEYCQSEVVPGPDQKLKWGVPDALRDPATGELLHDDLLLSAALCAVLEDQPWPSAAGASIVRRADPLAEMEREGF
jgi:hypothetical protein